MSFIKHISFLLILGMSFTGWSQNLLTQRAYQEYENENYETAKTFIDSAIVSELEMNASQTWRLRAFIYRRLGSQDTSKRSIAIQSIYESNKLDTNNVYKEKNAQTLNQIIRLYFIDAVNYLNNNEIEKSKASYDTYMELYKTHISEDFEFTEESLNYFNALASSIGKTLAEAESEEKIEELQSMMLQTYQKVIDVDNNNYNANYNSAIIYYNKGVSIILTLASDASLEELITQQDKCIEYFKKSLPYMLQAYEQNPENLAVLEGLWGIYVNLNQPQKALEALLKSYNLDPSNADTLNKLRITYYNLGDIEQSDIYAKKLDELQEK